MGGTMKRFLSLRRSNNVFAALLVAILVIIACGLWLYLRMPPRDTWSSLEEMTRSHIRTVLTWASDYHDRTGEWPDPNNWQSVLHNHITDRAGQRVFDRAVTDAWGSPLHCEVVGTGEHTGFRCRSFGPDRTDGNGSNDDISAMLQHNEFVIEHGWTEYPQDMPSTAPAINGR